MKGSEDQRIRGSEDQRIRGSEAKREDQRLTVTIKVAPKCLEIGVAKVQTPSKEGEERTRIETKKSLFLFLFLFLLLHG